jgi:hypothetical protein
MIKTKQAVHAIGQHVGFMPMERGTTLPMVCYDADRLMLVNMFYWTRSIPNEGMYITDPQYIGMADLLSGDFKFIKQFEDAWQPKELLPAPWMHTPYRFEKPEEILAEYDSLYALYDRLIPFFVSRNRLPSNDSVADAKQYLLVFDRHAEKPLLPYYQKFGGSFLDRVREIARI